MKSNEAKCFKVGVLLFYFPSSTNSDPALHLSGSDLTVPLIAEILFSLLIDVSLKQPFSIQKHIPFEQSLKLSSHLHSLLDDKPQT